jgi:hypothetical protein
MILFYFLRFCRFWRSCITSKIWYVAVCIIIFFVCFINSLASLVTDQCNNNIFGDSFNKWWCNAVSVQLYFPIICWTGTTFGSINSNSPNATFKFDWFVFFVVLQQQYLIYKSEKNSGTSKTGGIILESQLWFQNDILGIDPYSLFLPAIKSPLQRKKIL